MRKASIQNRKGVLIVTWLMVIAALNLLSVSAASRPLDQGFQSPPQKSAGVRCWWWWLNGNVTKEAITRDLEEMRAKGFSGAMIFDASSSNYRVSRKTKAGPLYGSAEWRTLYKHALKEAERLGLTLGLSIQSGWNLGGPNVTPDFAAKQITWSEIQIQGGLEYMQKLPRGYARKGYYKDITVLAFKNKNKSLSDPPFGITASSSQKEFPVSNVFDRNNRTFWVSQGTKPGQGPSAQKPESITLTFEKEIELSEFYIQGRKGYGPKNLQVVCVEAGKKSSVIVGF